MTMEQRTFGWIQNPSSTDNLKKVVSLFVPQSDFYKDMVDSKLPFLNQYGFLANNANNALYDEFLQALTQPAISYALLKGKGCGSGTRAGAKCSGLAQAALVGQRFVTYTNNGKTLRCKKPYTDDWTADGFLRWAVSLGFLDYNYNDDSCSVTPLGKQFVLSVDNSQEEKDILGTAYLSYPPVCRVLNILSDGQPHTKFEIGKQLGFTDEAGFTSIPQNIWVQAFEETQSQEERTELRNNVEGSSDKYARMICGWLVDIGWVKRTPKQVTETFGIKQYTTTITAAFSITAEGLKNNKRAIGTSKSPRVPKIVYKEMLASKASDANLLRIRRAYIIKYIGGTTKHTLEQIAEYLKNNGIISNTITIKDDIQGFINIGLNIQEQMGLYHLSDKILKLYIPAQRNITEQQTEQSVIKERVRARLNYIDHKYLTLIDYSFQGKDSKEFEIFTIDLFTNELQFVGKHLGGTRKPDGIISYNDRGVIIDNKAYSQGFNITRSMADEMIRYVQENIERREERNPNKWWESFPVETATFSFLFISSLFRGDINHMLNNIKESTGGTNGAVLNSENLLYFADAIKGGTLSQTDFLNRLVCNTEVIY